MKITFIDPPNFLTNKNIERVFGCTYTLYPMPNIFSLSCAAVLRAGGFEVKYIDMANEHWCQKKAEYFLKNDNSDMYVFHSVNLSIKPDMFFYKKAKAIKNKSFFVFSGPAPTYFPEDFIKDHGTFVVRGEAEYTLLELAECLKNGADVKDVCGVSFFKDDKIFNNKSRALISDLDKLPCPARDLTKKEIYYNPKLVLTPFTALQTSRGCPYRCMFCVPASCNFAISLEERKARTTKDPVRSRSADSVIEEFRNLGEEGYRSASVIDDQFLLDEKRTIDICEGVRGLNIKWGCLARADRINDKIAKALSVSGCRYIDMGVESFDQNVLNDIRKDLNVERVYEAVHILKKYNIMVKINLLFGVSALQTIDSMKKDVSIAGSLDVDAVMFSLATPFPGTDFYDRAKKEGWFCQNEYYPESVQSRSVINYPGVSHVQLNSLIRYANLVFYLSPKFLFKNIKMLAHPKNLYRALIALKRKFI